MRKLQIIGLLVALFLTSNSAAQSSRESDDNFAAQTDAYLDNIAKQELEERRIEISKLQNASDVRARQSFVERALYREIGEFPKRTALHATITGTIEHPDYSVQKLVYQSLPGFYVTADVYVPKNQPKPFPAVMGVAGHSPDGKAYANYQTVWVSLARRGILVLAIDPIGQGERIEHLDPVTHRPLLRAGGTAEHMADGLPVLLTGTNIARYMIWDGIRGIDYLQSRNDVDDKRIGVAGNSGGGTQSAYISALDKRVAVSVISCYLSGWGAAWESPGPQDSEQVFSGFLHDHLDFADFLNNIAPRPAEMEVATQDFFPIAGAHATFQEAQHIYDLLGQKNRISMFEANDPHGWSKPRRIAAYMWLSTWLKGAAGASEEAAVELDSPEALRATSTGQVLTSYSDAATVQSLNAALAKELRSKPFQGSRGQLVERVKYRLGLPQNIRASVVEDEGKFSQGDLNAERLHFHTESAVTVPALLFMPPKPTRRPATIYIDPSGMMAGIRNQSTIGRSVENGEVLLMIDPRGWGENQPPNKMISGYPSDYQLAMHAIMVGKSVPGMQTLDLVSVFKYLRTRPEIDPDSISVHAVGAACDIGLFAAIVEPQIKDVVCDKQPTSFLEMTQLPPASVSAESIVPGILQDFDISDLTRALGHRVRIEK